MKNKWKTLGLAMLLSASAIAQKQQTPSPENQRIFSYLQHKNTEKTIIYDLDHNIQKDITSEHQGLKGVDENEKQLDSILEQTNTVKIAHQHPKPKSLFNYLPSKQDISHSLEIDQYKNKNITFQVYTTEKEGYIVEWKFSKDKKPEEIMPQYIKDFDKAKKLLKRKTIQLTDAAKILEQDNMYISITKIPSNYYNK